MSELQGRAAAPSRSTKKTLDEILDEVVGGNGVQTVAATEAERAEEEAPSVDIASDAMAILPPDKNGVGEANPLLGLLSSKAAMQLMGALPTVLDALKPNEGHKAAGGARNGSQSTGDAQALLCALRPYLGVRRRDLTDQLLRIWKLQAALRSIKFE